MTSMVITALGLGFFGSLHCAFMCGPLAIAGCKSGVSAPQPARAIVSYVAGRLVSYAFAGALFGHLGHHAAGWLSLPVLQRGLLLAIAALALVKGGSLLLARRNDLVSLRVPRRRRRLAPLRARFGGIARFVAGLLPRRALPLGLATGALPCGLLAGGWTLAAAAGTAVDGALVMACLWLSTTPALLASIVLSQPMARLARSPRLSGLLWCALAAWVSVRPLLEVVGGPCH
jgi:sulfite exporter TauE/SafE